MYMQCMWVVLVFLVQVTSLVYICCVFLSRCISVEQSLVIVEATYRSVCVHHQYYVTWTSVQVWNRRTNTVWAALTLAGHSGTVRCLHLHNNRLVSGSSDRTLKVSHLYT